jgi:hypothetical protein
MDSEHVCDAYCDPDDENHRDYRKAVMRAQVASDQAWASVRNNLNQYKAVRDKVSTFVHVARAQGGGQISLSLAEWAYIHNALNILVGETRRRQSLPLSGD